MREYKCVKCNHWDMADCFEIRGNEPVCSICVSLEQCKQCGALYKKEYMINTNYGSICHFCLIEYMEIKNHKKPIDKKTKTTYTNK